MRCPFCRHEDTQVVDSRVSEDGAAIRRRRRCPSCDKRFTTYERVELALPSVVGPLNLALAGQIIFWVGVAYLALVLIAAAVPSRRRSTRRTVADPGTGERIERSETDLI